MHEFVYVGVIYLDRKILYGIPLMLIVAVVVISGCTENSLNNGSQNSSSKNTSSPIKIGNITCADVYVVVNSTGKWTGTIDTYINGSVKTNGSTQTFTGGMVSNADISGSGEKIYSIFGNLTGIEVSISLTDNVTTPLNVELIKNGRIVEAKTSTSGDGTVLLKYGGSVPSI